jgi:hypothetical protein
MYKYFDFKKIFESESAMMPEEGATPTISEPKMTTVDLKKMNATSKLHLLLTGTEVDQLKTQGFLNKTAEWKEVENETKIVPMQVSLYNADSGKPSPTAEDGVLMLTITNQKLDEILSGIEGGNKVETEIPSTDKTLEGQPVQVSLTREIDITSVKPGEVAVPASQQQLEEPIPASVEGTIGESFKLLMKFNQFVNESRKKEKITSETIAKELKKLEGKSKKKEDVKKASKPNKKQK